MAKIVAYGELLWDLLPSGKVLGGAPANFIFRINTFGDEGVLITRLGNDEPGKKAREAVIAIGLSDEHIQTDYEFPTGTVNVKIDAKGSPEFTIIRDVAYDHIELSSEMTEQVRQADCLYFGSLIQRYGISKNTLRELVKESGNAIKFLDINLRKDCYTRETIRESLATANILKINDEELFQVKLLTGLYCNDIRNMAGELVSRFGIDLVLVTLGAKGAFLISRNNDMCYSAGHKVKLVDTVGSGDAFSAGFIHSYLSGENLQASLDFGNASGALAATTKGATVPFSKTDVLNFMEQSHERVTHELFVSFQ